MYQGKKNNMKTAAIAFITLFLSGFLYGNTKGTKKSVPKAEAKLYTLGLMDSEADGDHSFITARIDRLYEYQEKSHQ